LIGNSLSNDLFLEIVYMAVKKKSAKPKTAAKKKTTTKKKTVSRKAPVKKKTTARKTVKKAASGKKAVTRKKTAAKKKAAPRKKVAVKKAATRKKAAPRKRAATRRVSPKTVSQVGPVPGITPYTEKKGEEYMNEDQVRHFRNILLTWKKELMEEVDRTVHHMQDDAANFPDPNDRATQESEFSMELRARDRERKLIKKIDESMEDLENKEYGYCEACGVEIGVKRLEARPTATLCIDCKILDEIKEKQMS
jgi:DnaK suppressor protein